MSGPSHALVLAMELVRAGTSPYAAAQVCGIALSTMYRSALYKAWKAKQPARQPVLG